LEQPQILEQQLLDEFVAQHKAVVTTKIHFNEQVIVQGENDNDINGKDGDIPPEIHGNQEQESIVNKSVQQQRQIEARQMEDQTTLCCCNYII